MRKREGDPARGSQPPHASLGQAAAPPWRLERRHITKNTQAKEEGSRGGGKKGVRKAYKQAEPHSESALRMLLVVVVELTVELAVDVAMLLLARVLTARCAGPTATPMRRR